MRFRSIFGRKLGRNAAKPLGHGEMPLREKSLRPSLGPRPGPRRPVLCSRHPETVLPTQCRNELHAQCHLHATVSWDCIINACACVQLQAGMMQFGISIAGYWAQAVRKGCSVILKTLKSCLVYCSCWERLPLNYGGRQIQMQLEHSVMGPESAAAERRNTGPQTFNPCSHVQL